MTKETTSIQFSDLHPWQQLHFKVSMCTQLGEHPQDHGLTVEEIDFIIRMLDERSMCPREKPFVSYADGEWVWKYGEWDVVDNDFNDSMDGIF